MDIIGLLQYDILKYLYVYIIYVCVYMYVYSNHAYMPRWSITMYSYILLDWDVGIWKNVSLFRFIFNYFLTFFPLSQRTGMMYYKSRWNNHAITY